MLWSPTKTLSQKLLTFFWQSAAQINDPHHHLWMKLFLSRWLCSFFSSLLSSFLSVPPSSSCNPYLSSISAVDSSGLFSFMLIVYSFSASLPSFFFVCPFSLRSLFLFCLCLFASYFSFERLSFHVSVKQWQPKIYVYYSEWTKMSKSFVHPTS